MGAGRRLAAAGPLWGCPPEVLVSGGVADAVLRQLGEQLVRLLRPLRVLLLDLLDELGDVAVARRITQKLVVDLRALEGVVLDRDEVVDDVAGSGAGHSAPSIGFSRTPWLCPPCGSRSLSMWSVTPNEASTLDDVTETWRSLPAAQQPAWPDAALVEAATRELSAAPGLVVPDECDTLRERLAAVARGEAFLLQGGDCAETFAGVGGDQVRDKLRTIL